MFRRAILLFVIAFFGFAGAAKAADTPFILVDLDSGEVLAERLSGELWFPASLTKLMTVYLLFDALADDRLELNSPIIVTENATNVQPSRMGFPAGTIVTVENALKMLIVKSANDIAIAVAELMSTSEAEFIAEMNRTASALGMIGTRFANPHGLPGTGQYSTARDMALLARTIWVGFPEYRHFFAIAEIRYGTAIMPTGNSLIEFYPGSNGMKTGFICAAGFNVAATATRGERSLLAVVLGAPDPIERATTAALLFDTGFAAPADIAGPALSGYLPTSTVTAPVSLRSTICPANAGGTEEAVDPRDLLVAAFGEPPPLPEPEVVFTGGADMDARLRVYIPLPRMRPTDVLGVAESPEIAAVPLPRPRPAGY